MKCACVTSASLSMLNILTKALKAAKPLHPSNPGNIVLALLSGAFLVLGSRMQADSPPDPLANLKSKKAVVLLFIARDCPISNSYAPEINRLCAQYTPQKIAFYMVYPDPDTTLVTAKKHAREYGYTSSVLLDPGHRLTHRAGATVTPEAAVFAPDGNLLYRGRIDDLYIGFGKRRYAATRHDLRLVLEAAVQGKITPRTFTKPVGCFIP